MYNFLIECTQTYTNFIEDELIAILQAKNSYYAMYKIENTSLYMVTCDINTIDFVINRSIFVKQVNFYGFCCVNELKNVLLRLDTKTYTERNKIEKYEKSAIYHLDTLKNCVSDITNEHCCDYIDYKHIQNNFECKNLQEFANKLSSENFTAKIITTTIYKVKNNQYEILRTKEIKKNAKKTYKKNCENVQLENIQKNNTVEVKNDKSAIHDNKKQTKHIGNDARCGIESSKKIDNKQQQIEAYKKFLNNANINLTKPSVCLNIINIDNTHKTLLNNANISQTNSSIHPNLINDANRHKTLSNNNKNTKFTICLNNTNTYSTYKTFLYTQSKRKDMLKYDINYRPFIGITSMDWELSIFMCNLLNITKNQIVLDPFVGSGGLLMAACYFDAYVLGIEYDIKMLVGCNDRNGNVRTSLKGYNIFDNFRFINKENKLLGILNGNMFNFRMKKCVDYIITDPPYGDRVSLNKKESKCFVTELKKMCDATLNNNGKVCFWSVCGNEETIFDDYALEYKKTQILGTVTRTLFVFAKK